MNKVDCNNSYIPLEGYSNIFIHSGIKINKNGNFTQLPASHNPKNVFTFKYTEFQYLKQSLERRFVYFARPNQWEDPFEQKFYEEEKEINGQRYQVFCLCITIHDKTNEECLWKTYTNTHDGSGTSIVDREFVRISYNMRNFYNALSTKQDYTFYMSAVHYVDRSCFFLENPPEPNSIEEYLNLLCQKLSAYTYENEFRLFAVRQGEINDNEKGIMIDINYRDIIKQITLPPLKSNYNEASILKISIMAKYLRNNHVKFNVSTLYDTENNTNTKKYKKIKI